MDGRSRSGRLLWRRITPIVRGPPSASSSAATRMKAAAGFMARHSDTREEAVDGGAGAGGKGRGCRSRRGQWRRLRLRPRVARAASTALKSGSIAADSEDGGRHDDRGPARGAADDGERVADPVPLGRAHRLLQAALEPLAYTAVYRSPSKIILDNNNLAQPALSVSARGAGRSPRNAEHIAKTVRTLMETDWEAAALAQSPVAGGAGRDPLREVDTSMAALVCPGAVSLGCCREGGVLRRAGATEASVELAKMAGLPPVGLHARLPPTSLDALRLFATRWGIRLSSTADLQWRTLAARMCCHAAAGA